MDIGQRIQQLRKERGLSQEELALELGVSRQSVSKWESGASVPDSDKVIALSELFSVTTDYILTGKRDTPEPMDDNLYEEIFIGENALAVSEEYDEEENTENTESAPSKNEKPFRLRLKKALAAVLAVVLVFTAVIAYPLGWYEKLFLAFKGEPETYPYVLVHGMGGWGSDQPINDLSPYWGSTTGSLSSFLRANEVEVAEATVGPFSSAWDRACELYAQLTGTTVDYGEAHSKAHGHSRYGKTYTQPIVKGWGAEDEAGKIKKVNLIGHSFGGNTVTLLTSLLEYGCEEERLASPDSVSPLFEGGKGEYVHSVTTLAAPHNGSTLYYVVDKHSLVQSALGILYAVGGVAGAVEDGLIDFQLDHFGIESGTEQTLGLVNYDFMNGTDNAFYDLSPDGAALLNEKTKTVESVYYFSYAYCTTQKSALSGKQVPTPSTMLVLQPFAALIGSYKNESTEAKIKIDENWLPNDGLVNVISARAPQDEEQVEYSSGMEIETGKWYAFPVVDGDHGKAIGMDGNVQQTRDFYLEHIALVDSLPN